MARQLWLLRHGDAEPHTARGSDAERRLTARGEAQADAAGAALRRLGIEVGACFASPKARAWDTAARAAAALGLEPVRHNAVAGGFSAAEARALSEADEQVLVVGHEPDLSQVLHDLTGARVRFGKGAVAAVRLDGGAGELVVLLRPRELEAIAAGA